MKIQKRWCTWPSRLKGNSKEGERQGTIPNPILLLILIGKSDYRGGNKVAHEIAKGKAESVAKDKHKADEPKGRNRDIKCWKCQGVGHVSKDFPNKRTMTIRNGEIVTDEEESDHASDKDEMPELESCSDGSIEEPIKGDMLVTRRALSTQIKEDCIEEQ